MSEAKPHPIMHLVKKGDTLRSVCDMYGLDPKVIYEFGTNKELMSKMKVPELLTLKEFSEKFEMMFKEVIA